MLHKYLFNKGDVPLIYDVSRKEKTDFEILIPKGVIPNVTKEMGAVSEETMENYLGIGKAFPRTIIPGRDYIVLSFGLKNLSVPAHESLCRVFDCLNNKKIVPENALKKWPKQTIAFTLVRTSLAASFAPWTHKFLKDQEFSKEIFGNALEETKKFYSSFLEQPGAGERIEFYIEKNGFYLQLLGNGVWLHGSYGDEFTTHNCDHSCDQLTFFFWLVCISDGLKAKVSKL